MKKIFKLILAMLCVCMVISSSACSKTKTLGEITSKLIASGYQMTFTDSYSAANNFLHFIEFENDYIAIQASNQSKDSIKQILVLSFSTEADFNLAIDERENIVWKHFGKSCVYTTSGKTIIFGSDESALADIGDVSYDKDLAKIVNNLISNGYRLNYNQSANKDYSILEAKKNVSILGMTKQKTITTYIFRDKNILNSYYDECKDFYQEEIESGELLLEKKGNLLVVANGESAKKDALGK